MYVTQIPLAGNNNIPIYGLNCPGPPEEKKERPTVAKVRFFFSFFFYKTLIMTLKKCFILTYIFTIEPSWNNIFEQSFGPESYAETSFKLL